MVSIYRIKNNINNKVYIGKTKNLTKRLNEHKRDAVKGSELMIHRMMRKCGPENYIIDVLCECFDDDAANLCEKAFILYYDSNNKQKGYNMTEGGDGGDVFTNHPDKEGYRERLSIGKKKLCQDPEHRKKISEGLRKSEKAQANKGKTPYDFWVEKYGKEEADRRKDEWRKKLSKASKGKPKSKEHNRKVSEALKGRRPAQEAIDKMKETKRKKKESGWKRKPISEETRKKLSDARKKWWEEKGAKQE